MGLEVGFSFYLFSQSLIFKLGRLVRATWSDTNDTIDRLSAALVDLKESFDRGLACQAVFLSETLLQKVEMLGMLKTF